MKDSVGDKTVTGIYRGTAGQITKTAASLFADDFHWRDVPGLNPYLQYCFCLSLKNVSEVEVITEGALPVGI